MRINRILAIVFVLPSLLFSQWTDSGSGEVYTTDNVGIGMTSPWAQLHVDGNMVFFTGSERVYANSLNNSSTDRLFKFSPLTKDGSNFDWSREFGYDFDKEAWFFESELGLGTRDPQAMLDVRGDVDISSGTGSWVYLDISSTNPNTDPVLRLNAGTVSWSFHNDDSSGNLLDIRFNNSRRVSIDSTGKVGIGTSSPNNKLDVAGIIRAEEVIVETGWADFVFEDGYDLMPLDVVREYIEREKRLPGIPSEREVLEKGVSLGEIQKLLLQKIEELTLHVINQEKRIQALELENRDLKNNG